VLTRVDVIDDVTQVTWSAFTGPSDMHLPRVGEFLDIGKGLMEVKKIVHKWPPKDGVCRVTMRVKRI